MLGPAQKQLFIAHIIEAFQKIFQLDIFGRKAYSIQNFALHSYSRSGGGKFNPMEKYNFTFHW